MHQQAAARKRRVGEDVSEFVANHRFEFRLVEQVEDRPIELDGGEAPEARQQAQGNGLRVDVFVAHQIDRAGAADAEFCGDAVDRGEQRVAGVSAKAGVGSDGAKPLAIGGPETRQKVEQAQHTHRHERRGLSRGGRTAAGHHPGDAARGGRQLERQPGDGLVVVPVVNPQQVVAARGRQMPRGRQRRVVHGRLSATAGGQMSDCTSPRSRPSDGRARVW